MQQVTRAEVLRLVARHEWSGGIEHNAVMGAFHGRPSVGESVNELLGEGYLHLQTNNGKYRITMRGRIALLKLPRDREERAVLAALGDRHGRSLLAVANDAMLPASKVSRTLAILFQCGMVGTLAANSLSNKKLWLRTTPGAQPMPGVEKLVVTTPLPPRTRWAIRHQRPERVLVGSASIRDTRSREE